MKNILITGGLGYIGSSLMKQLDFRNVNKITTFASLCNLGILPRGL